MVRYGYRRRLGARTWGRGNYANLMGFKPMPFTRKRTYTQGPGATTTTTAAPLRMGRRVGTRVQRFMARSGTRTVTQRKRRKISTVAKHGDNASTSTNRIGKAWLTRFEKLCWKKVVAPQRVYDNSAVASWTSNTGQQQAVSYSFMSKGTLTAMETAANGGTTTNNDVRFFLRSGKAILKMRNQSNSTAKVMIYDIVTKTNAEVATLDTPIEAWTKGLTDFGLPSGTINALDQRPTRSPEFNYIYGINNVTQVFLEPGQQHEHVVYHSWNRVLNSVRFQNSASLSIKGLTRHIMIVFNGLLGHESLQPNEVAAMPVRLDVAYTTEYSYGWIEKTQKAYTVNNVVPTIDNFDFMGENQDVDLDPADA